MSSCIEECAGISYDYEDFDEVYVPRVKLQRELVKAVLKNKLTWVDGPGGSGKSTLVSWLVRELVKEVDKYRILPIPVRIKPRSIGNVSDAIKLLVESGVRDYLKGDEAGKFLDSARKGLDYLDKFLKTASIVLRAPLGFALNLTTLVSNLLCFLGMLYNKAHKHSQAKSEEEFLRGVADELGKEIGKRFKDFKYTEALLIVDDLGDLSDETSRMKVLEVLTYLAKEVQALKVLVVRRRFKVKRPIGKKLLGVLEVEEEDLLRDNYCRVEVPGLSRDELDILKRIVKTLPLKSKRKFRFKEGEEDEIAEELFKRTGGLPRMLCVAMYLYLKETRRLKDWDLLTLRRVRKYVESDTEKILDSFLDYLATTYGGIYAEKFREVLELASCMPSFTEEELIGITGHKKGVERFLEWRGIERSGKTLFLTQVYDFNENWYWLKHTVYETVLSNEEKRRIHEKILEYSKSEERTLRKDAMTVYHAEELLKLISYEEERKKLARLIVEKSTDLSGFAYDVGIPLMTVEYGLKAYNYAKELKMWIEALKAAERVLRHAVHVQLLEEMVKSIKNELREIFEKAKEINEDDARYLYAFTLRSWAFYALNALNDIEEAESAVDEGLRVVGSKNSKLIYDELKWYDAYSVLLGIQADIAIRGNFDSAMEILEELKRLLDEYKGKIIERCGETKYYERLAVIENRLGLLTYMMADSEDKLRESLKYYENFFENSLKTGKIVGVAKARMNLAMVMMFLAESSADFESAVDEKIEGFDLNECIKIFKKFGDRFDEAKAKRLMSISLLANRKDERAVKLAKEAFKIAKKGSSKYIKAMCKLTLAYILMVSNLDEFRKNARVAKLVTERTLSASSKFEELEATSTLISHAIRYIESYLLGNLDFDGLLEVLDRLISMLEERKNKIRAWVLRRVRGVIEREGLNKGVLRTVAIKLLLTL